MTIPDLRALEIAAMAIKAGGMSAAAQQLGVTQSAVSQAMKRAEAQINAALVHRDRRPIIATKAGRVLVDQMHAFALQAGNVIEKVRLAGACPEISELRLGMIDTFASTVGPILIRDLLKEEAALRVSAFSGLAHAHAEALSRDEIDVLISSDPLEDVDGLTRFTLYREPFVLVCPASLADGLAPLSLRELLVEQPLIRYSARSHMGTQISRHLRRLRIEHPLKLSFDTSDALISMVAGGLGVAITTPLCLIQTGRRNGRVAVLPLSNPGFSRELTLITRRGELDRLGRRIAELARQIMRRHILHQIVAEMPWLNAVTDGMVSGEPLKD